MSDRFRNALKRAVMKVEQEQWEYGQLGRKGTDGTYTFVVPGRSTFVYVTMRNSAGAQTVVTARNDAGVEHAPRLNVKMRLEYGVYVIYGKTGRQELGVNPPSAPDGVPSHNHDTLYWPRVDHIEIGTGIANYPIVTNDDGVVDLTLIPVTQLDLLYAPIAKGVTNGDSHDHSGGDGGTIAYASLSGTPTVYTQEQIEDFVGAMVGGTETGISVTYDDGTGLLIFDAQTAGDLRYAPIAKGVTNGDSHDHLGGDGGVIAYSSLSGTPTVYTQEQIEDFVGAMVGGVQTNITVTYQDATGLIDFVVAGGGLTQEQVEDYVGAMVGGTETGISVTYDDVTGTLTFDAQTAGDARYGRLASTNTWAAVQTMSSRIHLEGGNAIRMIDAVNVAHGMTSVVSQTDQYGNIGLEGTSGGLLFTGLSDGDAYGWRGRGVIGTATPTTTTPAVVLAGSKKNVATHQALASNETVLQIWNLTTPVVAVKGDGSMGVGTVDVENLHASYGGIQLGQQSLLMYGKSTDGAYLTNNAFYDGTWKRRAIGQATMVQINSAGIDLQVAASAAADSAITWLNGLSVDITGEVGIGTANPQGKLHIVDGVSSKMFVSKSAVGATKVVIVADGTGDVTKYVLGRCILTQGATTNAMSIACANNASMAGLVVGTGTWTFSVALNGEFSVIRTAGTGTVDITIDIEWQ